MKSGTELPEVARLYAVMKRLRGPGGCPWDREQTLQTLKPCLLEETYELLETMEGADPAPHLEELGDVLLQVVFQCAIREEEGLFGLNAVAAALTEKLIRRHPRFLPQTTHPAPYPAGFGGKFPPTHPPGRSGGAPALP